MGIRKVRVGSVYYYNPALLDRVSGPINLKEGEQVRVVQPHGCPPANTMGHCHVETLAGRFVGLVQTSSLDTAQQYREYLLRKIAECEGKTQEPATPRGYVGIVQHADGRRSFDWSVSDIGRYQAVIDVVHKVRPVVQAFLVPAAYEQAHAIDWDTITVSDLNRAGCGTTILYPRTDECYGTLFTA